MGCTELNDKGGSSVSRVLVVGLSLLVITWDVTTYGKSLDHLRTKEANSSQRHYVVTEEETEDTFFVPPQVSYPAVIPHYPVPVITQTAAQPEPKKPKENHANQHKQEHVLMPPRKTGNANDEHAKNSENTWRAGYSGNAANSGTSMDNNGDTKGTWDKKVVENSDNTRNKESTSPHLTSSELQKLNAYRNVGCYKDALPRAVPSLEGSDPILTGYYKNRRDAVEKCGQVAKTRGYQVFTVRNGGFCSSGPTAHRTFQIYGPADNCKSGKGGKWANDVYIFNDYWYELTVHTGIEQKSSTDAEVSVVLYGVMGSSRHIPLKSQISTNINDPFQSGQVEKFIVHTVPLGDLIRLHICLDNKGPSPEWYLEKVSIKDPRNKIFIFPCNCWLKRGKKGSISERQLLPAVVINPESFKYIGCYKHPKTNNIRALQTQEYKILDGHPSAATLPNKSIRPKNIDYVIEMCAQNAHAREYTFFAIHDGHECISSSTFQDTYDKYGKAYDCSKTGRGGRESIAVYTFTNREPPPIRTPGAT